MNSIILHIASKYLKVLLWIIALLALLRGHNYPGGGFIGGLLASIPILFGNMVYSESSIRNNPKVKPENYLAIGWTFVLLSAFIAVFTKSPVMKGTWLLIELPFNQELKLGTPLLFDSGIFFIVIGVILLFFFNLSSTK